MRVPLPATLVLILTTACADSLHRVATSPPPYDSPVSGSIGVAVANRGNDVVVTDVRANSPAARAGVVAGDRIAGCNGAAVTSALDFERRVLDSRTGSVLEL